MDQATVLFVTRPENGSLQEWFPFVWQTCLFVFVFLVNYFSTLCVCLKVTVWLANFISVLVFVLHKWKCSTVHCKEYIVFIEFIHWVLSSYPLPFPWKPILAWWSMHTIYARMAFDSWRYGTKKPPPAVVPMSRRHFHLLFSLSSWDIRLFVAFPQSLFSSYAWFSSAL